MIDETKLIDEVNDLMDANLLFYDDASKSRQETLDEIVDLIDEQPKVGEWIPCSERLPEEQTDYKGIKRSYCSLVTVIGYGVSRIDIDYTVNGIWHLEEANTVLKVLAWQPLPKSYEVKE